MDRTLTASDRKALIRLASALPKGSEERKAVLSGLQKTSSQSKLRKNLNAYGKELMASQQIMFSAIKDLQAAHKSMGGLGMNMRRLAATPFGEDPQDFKHLYEEVVEKLTFVQRMLMSYRYVEGVHDLGDKYDLMGDWGSLGVADSFNDQQDMERYWGSDYNLPRTAMHHLKSRRVAKTAGPREPAIHFVEHQAEKYGAREENPIPSLRAWRWEDGRGYYGLSFVGKNPRAKRVSLFQFFRTEGERDRRYDSYVTFAKARMNEKAKRREEARNFQHGLKVGDILDANWGYNQTNIDFFQVVDLIGTKMVAVRPIEGKVVRHDVGQQYVVPAPGKFKGSKVYRKKPGRNNGVSINSSVYATPWNGKPQAETAPGYGH
tara:strand:+ start:786 stop:1913 length:1128 start_codon:yes stop_codon:yes gene_type:complete